MDCLFWRWRENIQITPNNSNSLARFIPLIDRNITGIIAAISCSLSLLIDSSISNSVVIFWVLVRAIRSATKYDEHPIVPIISMCLSASQILSTWIRCPEEMAPSYWKFLNYHGGKPDRDLRLYHQDLAIVPLACTYAHPTMSCKKHFVVFFIEGLQRAMPVYLPIYVLSFIFSTRRNILTTLKQLFMSSAFLSSYCALAWASSCIMFPNFPGVTRFKLFISTWLAGMSIFLERPSRRKELAAYCVSHALNSVWNYFKRKSEFKSVNWMGNLLLIIGVSIVMKYHELQPLFVTKFMLGLQYQKIHLKQL